GVARPCRAGAPRRAGAVVVPAGGSRRTPARRRRAAQPRHHQHAAARADGPAEGRLGRRPRAVAGRGAARAVPPRRRAAGLSGRPVTVRIATRRSALARAQATQVGLALGVEFELVPLETTGDRHPDRAVEAFETKGLFVDAIRDAVIDGTCDLAVHSGKDLPADDVPGLTIAAHPRREDPRDVLVTRDGHALATLPSLATIGTSSARRRLQLL